MGKSFVAKKVSDRLTTKPVFTGKVQKKTDKIKEKRSRWVDKISRQTEEKIEKSKAPLESLNLIRRTLEDTVAEITAEGQKPSQAPAVKETLRHVSSRRGRKNALKSEMEQFKQVMGHQLFRKNPTGILQEHLANTVKLQQKEAANL